MLKSLFLLCMSFFIGCACSNSYIGFNSPYALKQASKSVVRVTVEYVVQDPITMVSNARGKYATGFSIASNDNVSMILTNQHVCSMRENANYTLTIYNGKKVKAKFVDVATLSDICILRAEQPIVPLPLAKKDALKGERVFSIGAPDGVYPVFYDGLVSGYHEINMENEPPEDGLFEVHFFAQVTSLPVYGGSSGSPVLNTQGKVVGIVFAGRHNKDHISFIVPINEVLKFLNEPDQVFINN